MVGIKKLAVSTSGDLPGEGPVPAWGCPEMEEGRKIPAGPG